MRGRKESRRLCCSISWMSQVRFIIGLSTAMEGLLPIYSESRTEDW